MENGKKLEMQEVKFLFLLQQPLFSIWIRYPVHYIPREKVKSFSEDGEKMTGDIMSGKPHIRVVRVFSRWEPEPPQPIT